MTISKRALRRARGRRQQAGWYLDDDGWLVRPRRAGDPLPGDFAISLHAFIVGDELFCRNKRQAAILDCGGMV